MRQVHHLLNEFCLVKLSIPSAAQKRPTLELLLHILAKLWLDRKLFCEPHGRTGHEPPNCHAIEDSLAVFGNHEIQQFPILSAVPAPILLELPNESLDDVSHRLIGLCNAS